MLEIVNEICLHLGRFYAAYRVMQDSGIWMYDVEGMAHYMFSRMVNDAKR
jgi:hypothetical protein